MKATANPRIERFLQVTAEILRLTLRLDEVDVEAGSEEAAELIAEDTQEGRELNRMLDDYTRLMAEFQAAVLQLFGEKPAADEDTAEFFGRIYRMSAEEWSAMAKRNGVKVGGVQEGGTV